MAYTLNDGQGSLFKNSRKEQPNQPDYQGNVKTPDGKEYRLAGWIREGKDGREAELAVAETERAAEWWWGWQWWIRSAVLILTIRSSPRPRPGTWPGYAPNAISFGSC